MRIISATLVRELLSMSQCIDLMQEAMVATSGGDVTVPQRQKMQIDSNRDLLLMPGFGERLPFYGAKLVSLHHQNPASGLPAVQGFVSLFDATTGEAKCLIDGASITGLRTAAASGLATRLLARLGSQSCGIYGTGVQARTHIDAMYAARGIKHFVVWARDFDKAKSFAESEVKRTGFDIQATEDPRKAASCDVICTVTGASEPVLKGEWVAAGCHINLVGCHDLASREADTCLICKSRLFVDSMAATLNEGGDFMIPISEGEIQQSHILGEIGQVATNQVTGRETENDITVYNSLGITSQDLYTACFLYQKAFDQDLGIEVPLS